MADVEEPVEDIVADEEAEEAEEVEEEDEEEFVGVGATEVKLFGKWSFDDIEIRDISLEVSAVVDALCVDRTLSFARQLWSNGKQLYVAAIEILVVIFFRLNTHRR